ncbi:hypothetical protein PG990_002349 [Apiospora arundinis]
MARSKRSNSSRQFWEAVQMIGKVLFTVAVILIFFMAIAVNTGAVKLPDWADTWQEFDPEKRNKSAAIVFSIVCTLFVFVCAAGIIQMLREGRPQRPSNTSSSSFRA